jgi:hypothetical protein
MNTVLERVEIANAAHGKDFNAWQAAADLTHLAKEQIVARMPQFRGRRPSRSRPS